MARRSLTDELANQRGGSGSFLHHVCKQSMYVGHTPAHVPLSLPVFIYPEVGGGACWRGGERWVAGEGD